MPIFNVAQRRTKNVANFLKRQMEISIGHRMAQARRYPAAGDIDAFIMANSRELSPSSGVRSLDLGCGEAARNPFCADKVMGVDVRENVSSDIRRSDLSINGIPFDSEYFTYVTAFDFIEHIPRIINIPETRFPFVELMNEIDRVLAKGGRFFSKTPGYPSKEAFQDPTHVNIITEDTLTLYFCGEQPLARMYGFKGNFRLVAQAWHYSWILTLLEKV